MIVLDASVLIAYLDRDDAHHERAERLLAHEIDDDFGANSLTLAEVLVAPARENRLRAARTALRDLEVEELACPADTAVKLARLRAATGLRMPDCCVLLAAEDVHGRVAAFDDQLKQAAKKRRLRVVTD